MIRPSVAGSAAVPDRVVGALAAETGCSSTGDGDRDPVRAGSHPGGFVDGEVVDDVAAAASDGGSQGWGFGGGGHLLVVQMRPQVAGAIGGIAQDLGALGLAVEKPGGGFGVAAVAGGEVVAGDEAGVGLAGDMGFVAVPVGVLGLVGVAGLGVQG